MLTNPSSPPFSLSETTKSVDLALARIDDEIDWLGAVSPLDNDQLWQEFKRSGYRNEPTLRYRLPAANLEALRQTLFELPVQKIEHPVIQALLREKQRELDRQIELVQLIDTPGFLLASCDLFGDCGDGLAEAAETILTTVTASQLDSDPVGCEAFCMQAERELDWYRSRFDGFSARVIVEDDLNSLLMVSQGNLHVAKSLQLPRSRVAPLIAHEIGTHVVSRFNGAQQPLHQLEVGLAHYNALQEGLGTLSEYLAGYLPAARLRVIAARVVAAQMVIDGNCSVVSIFQQLHETYRIDAEDAFDTAVRALRGGGLTKDAVYLRGLIELLQYLATGGDLDTLYLGKFALRHLDALGKLLDEGWVVPPESTPRHLQEAQARQRLEQVRTLSIAELFQEVPNA